MRGNRRLLAAVLVFAFALAPTVAYSAGTGDYMSDVRARPTREDRAVERAYQAWRSAKQATASGGVSGSVSAAVVTEAPYQYFYTPTHQQELDYWCGPATVQTIDDYWGTTTTQQSIAGMLGTTDRGTWFPALAPVLTQLTGVQYAISGVCSTNGDAYSRIQYGLLNRRRPVAADVRIVGSVWNNYQRNHDGHIIPIEAFDWRSMTVRINDPYQEATSKAGGGYTLGHRVYPAAQVAHGIVNHPQQVLVY